MKVICNRASLLEMLTAACGVAAGRTPKAILECVKISAAEEKLTVAATNLEISLLQSTGQVQVDQPGEVVADMARLRDIVRESGDDTVALSVEKDQLHIRDRDSHFKIATLPVADFPPVTGSVPEPTFQIKGSVLKQAIMQTMFAAAKEATRYAFNGVQFQLDGDKLVCAATDGRRLAVVRADLAATPATGTTVSEIVPLRTLLLIRKLIVDPDGIVSVSVIPSKITFLIDDVVLASNLIEGTFPPYEDVVPKECDRKLVASTSELISAIRRGGLLNTEESKGIRLTLSKKGLTIQGRSPNAGEATINLPCAVQGNALEIGFNPVFLTDGLNVANTDEVTVEFVAANRPGLITSGNFRYVVMPVSLA